MGITDNGMKAAPANGDKWLTESFGKGNGALLGRITPSSGRSFYFRYTGTTGQVRLPIGPFNPKGDGVASFTVAQARARAIKWSGLRREAGISDFREHLDQERQEIEAGRRAAEAERTRIAEEAESAAQASQRRATVRGLFEQWQRAELAPQTLADGTRTGRKDGGEWVRQSFERRVFPKLGDVHAEEVRRADLLAILDDCKADGRRRTANVLLADIRQMFRFAAERDIVPKNPLDGIKRSSVGGKDVERDRTLSDTELRALWAAVPTAGMHGRSQAAIWLILATGCRVGEAMGALWEHIDLKRDEEGELVSGTWYLPTTKNERDHTIHLSKFALRQVERLLELREFAPAAPGEPVKAVPWVFPNTARTAPVDIKSFGKQLADRQRQPERRIKNRAKNTTALVLAGGKWTAHDLRRTAATCMAKLGISTDVIDECLNHKLQSKMSRVYIQDRRLADQARAFDALGNRLDALAKDQASNVVQLTARAS